MKNSEISMILFLVTWMRLEEEIHGFIPQNCPVPQGKIHKSL
jgi:hypothetical protein